MYYVYIIQSKKDYRLYKGFTTDLKKRLREHNEGLVTYSKTWRPWRLIHYEAYLNKEDAIVREKYLKSGWGKRFIDKTLRHYFKQIRK